MSARYAVATPHDDYFLIVSRLIPYKRIDLAVKTFTTLGLPLRIIGAGRDEEQLRRMAERISSFSAGSPMRRCAPNWRAAAR